MKFNIGDRVRYIGKYSLLHNKTGIIIKIRQYPGCSYPIIVDFAESGFTFGHDGAQGTHVTSCWFICLDEIEIVDRKTIVYYKKL